MKQAVQLRKEQATDPSVEADRAIATDEAWLDYLRSTRNQIGYRYDEVEPWAWARLQARLRIINREQAAA